MPRWLQPQRRATRTTFGPSGAGASPPIGSGCRPRPKLSISSSWTSFARRLSQRQRHRKHRQASHRRGGHRRAANGNAQPAQRVYLRSRNRRRFDAADRRARRPQIGGIDSPVLPSWKSLPGELRRPGRTLTRIVKGQSTHSLLLRAFSGPSRIQELRFWGRKCGRKPESNTDTSKAPAVRRVAHFTAPLETSPQLSYDRHD